MHKPRRIKLGLGTLKIKPGRFLRQTEKDGQFPMVKLGKSYWIWVPNGQTEPAVGKPEASRRR